MHDPESLANPTSPSPEPTLEQIVDTVRAHTGVTGKRHIASIRRFVDTSDPLHGPGDDAAVIPVGDELIIACGEAIAPAFVRHDPHGAGIASVLACMNDVAATGGLPVGFVNTVVGPAPVTDEILRGIRDAAGWYDVPIVGGHLTASEGEPALSSFAVGRAERPLSMANVEPGQTILFAGFLDGRMRPDFPFFTSIDRQSHRLARDVRVLHRIASRGLAASAKDVSMAGALGSLAMLLEFRALGAVVDLDRLPVPEATDPLRWLVSFPTYAFFLTAEPGDVDACIAEFEDADLTCVAVGEVGDDTALRLRRADGEAVLLDFADESVTGLWRGGDEA